MAASEMNMNINILLIEKLSLAELILAVCEIRDVTLTVFGSVQLTAKRKAWKLSI